MGGTWCGFPQGCASVSPRGGEGRVKPRSQKRAALIDLSPPHSFSISAAPRGAVMDSGNEVINGSAPWKSSFLSSTAAELGTGLCRGPRPHPAFNGAAKGFFMVWPHPTWSRGTSGAAHRAGSAPTSDRAAVPGMPLWGTPQGWGRKRPQGLLGCRDCVWDRPVGGFPLWGDHVVVVTDVGLQLHPGAVGPGADEHRPDPVCLLSALVGPVPPDREVSGGLQRHLDTNEAQLKCC